MIKFFCSAKLLKLLVLLRSNILVQNNCFEAPLLAERRRIKLIIQIIFFFNLLLIAEVNIIEAESEPPAFITYNQKAIVTVKTQLIDVSPNTKTKLITDPKTKKTYLSRRQKMASYDRTATGIIVSSSGYILVNTHTIIHAPQITATIFNGETFPARVIQKAEGYDLTLIKIDSSTPLRPILWGNSNELTVKQKVFTISHPLQKPDIFQGKILALQKSNNKDLPIFEAIELNIRLEHGDSGSAVIDTEGKFIGMIAARSSHLKSHSFAIPSNLILQVFKKYINIVTPAEAGVQPRFPLSRE